MNFLKLASFPVLSTPRLVLREIRDGDFGSFHLLFKDPRVNDQIQLEWAEPLEARKWFEDFRSRFESGRGIRWAIVLRESGECIGNFGIHNLRPELNCIERGLQIASPHWRQGFGLEASKAVMNWVAGSTDLERIDTWISDGNTGSIALIRRQGFAATGEEKPFKNLRLLRFLIATETWRALMPQIRSAVP